MNQLHELVGSGKVVGNILQQNTHAERLGKRPQMLDRRHRSFEFLFTETLVRRSKVLNQKPERNLLCDFKSTFDLVHGFDTAGSIRRCNIDRRRPGTTPFVVSIERRMNGVQRNSAAPEPVGNFLHMGLAVGVVEVLACGKNLDRLNTRARNPVENARMKPLFYEKVG